MRHWLGPLTLAAVLALAAGCGKPPAPVQPAPRQAQPAAPAQPAPAPAQKVKQYNAPPTMTIDPKKQYFATLHTSKGDVRIELLPAKAPKTVNNFVFLAKDGFYDNVRFHRIIKTFMVQTGDPRGNGTGDPGYRFEDELPPQLQYGPGVVAMANSGPNTNGSQFFICTGDDSRTLNNHPDYTVFGKVVGGMDAVQAIASTPVGPGGRGEMSAPKEEVVIKSVTVEEQG